MCSLRRGRRGDWIEIPHTPIICLYNALITAASNSNDCHIHIVVGPYYIRRLVIWILIFHFDANQNNRKLWKWNLFFFSFSSIVSFWCAHKCVWALTCMHHTATCVVCGEIIFCRFIILLLPLLFCCSVIHPFRTIFAVAATSFDFVIFFVFFFRIRSYHTRAVSLLNSN